MSYAAMTLDVFLNTVLKAYPTVTAAITLLTDNKSPEYQAFHAKTLSEHVTTIWFQQRGVTYQVNRVSNLRGTTGYERYISTLWDENSLSEDDINIGYRVYKDEWYPWVTVKIAN